MTLISKKTIATALSIIVLSTSFATTSYVSSAEASMREHRVERAHRGGHRRHGGNSGRNMAIGMGVLGALAIISAVKAANDDAPKHVKRRCAQYGEWRALVKNAKRNAQVQFDRGDARGGNEWLKSARFYAKKADQARRDCKRWANN